MNSYFRIQEQDFQAIARPVPGSGFTVRSSPRPYQLDFRASVSPGRQLEQEIRSTKVPILLIDRRIKELYLDGQTALDDVPTFVVDATEDAKQIGTVLEIVEFLETHKATKTSLMFVVGGGILQDLGAFTGAMYKRGLPWTFVPTTLLAQGDSCVGGKTALNHKGTKNQLALFSAPRRIIIDTGFLKTLPRDELLSGAGETFRLCITGGRDFVNVFIAELQAVLAGDAQATSRMIETSLSAKRAVVEFDEFELDIRRSMNYGHSFGHAIEALSNYAIPHGVGVAIGILVENEISFRRGMLAMEDRNLLLGLGKQIITEGALAAFRDTSLDGILRILQQDKKTEGTVLKLATLESIGQIRFIDFPLDANGEQEMREAVAAVLAAL